MEEPQCIWPAMAQLGEGARYDAVTDEIWWVDILGQKIFCMALGSGQQWTWDTPETVGATLPDDSGHVLALFRHSLVRLDRGSGQFETVLDFPNEPRNNRFNDGAMGPDGSLWLASMDFDFKVPTGAVYRVLPDLKSVQVVDQGYVVANGPAVSPDGRRLFVNETMKGEVFVFDVDPTSGRPTNKRLFATIPPEQGLPDGLHVDNAGGLWVALVTGGTVRRFHPDGTADRDISVPSPTVTSVCFGRDADTMFVTTGRILMDEPTLAAHPLSGGLFRIDLRARGA
ncbi:MAG: SMP-30/gluconolactonase/LRE family protein [Devosia sp.]